jgi:hypothetical protein
MGLSEKVKIGLTKDQIQYIVRNSTYTYQEILDIIQAILKDTLAGVIKDLEQWIDKGVPKRTGQLRHFLKEWLHGSNVTKGILRIILKTNLEYAAAVNQMSASQVRHHGEVGYVYYDNIFGKRGKIILSDPSAEGNFFDKLYEFAKQRVAVNLVQAKNSNLGTGKGTLTTLGKVKEALA